MAKTSTKSSLNAVAYAVMLLVIAGLVSIIAYKRLFLAGKITGQLPTEKLAQSLEQCVKTYFKPLPADLAALGGNNPLVSSVLEGISSSVIPTRLQGHQLDEVKVLKIDDFWGKNAQIKLSGAIQIGSTLPVIGNMNSRQNYTLTLFKQGESYSFSEMMVKGEKQTDWQKWACAKQF